MMRRSTKIQLILFVILTLAGVSFVSAEYVGLTKGLFNDQCKIQADFADSGGIFTNAEVTYRGVAVGKVGAIDLREEGIRVSLDIDNCSGPKIPRSSRAVVTNRSVVGEQYVNLIPPNDKGPYFTGEGDPPIAQSKTAIPTQTNVLLVNLNRLLTSLPLNDLRTTVSELGKAFDGRGNDLGNLIDSSSLLLDAAQQNLPDTIALINNSATVLQTQLELKTPIASWARDLRLLSQQLKTSDGDIRRLVDRGPEALSTVRKLVRDNDQDIGVVLANLVTVGDIIVRHIDGVEQVLELYPALAAGGQSVVRSNPAQPGKNLGALGLVISDNKGRSTTNAPPDCGGGNSSNGIAGGREGYQGTQLRTPNQRSPIAPNVGARCTAPASSGKNVRGSQNVAGAPPISTNDAGTVYPRVITPDMTQVDTSLKHVNLGDAGWLAVLTASLR